MMTSSRRTFLRSASSLLVLPGGWLRGQRAKRLAIGFIGMGGKIQGHVSELLKMGHHAAAFCDVDEQQIAASKKRHGDPVRGVAVYRDYRELLARERSLDAAVIATPDHWHAPACRAAIRAGKHVYCEKPLTHTIAEARELREMSRGAAVVTQTGNQGSASPNLRRSIELIQAGFFGEIQDIHVWHPAHGWPSGEDRPAQGDAVPAGLDWDFWLGTAPVRDYKAGIYHPGKWRGWYDFGNGSLGDFCCHGFNMPVRALRLDYPEKIDVRGEGLGRESFATACTVTYHFPAREGRGAVRLHFYTGGHLPAEEVTAALRGTFGSLPRTGCLLVGEKGQLQSGLWNSDCYIKLNADAKFIGEGNHPAAKAVPLTLPRVKGQLDEWVDAIQGGPKVFADFDLGGHLTEIGLAGVVALRLQKSIPWDGAAMQAPGMPEADAFIRKKDRAAYAG